MAAQLNHTIVAAKDQREPAEFLAEMFGLPAPVPYGGWPAASGSGES